MKNALLAVLLLLPAAARAQKDKEFDALDKEAAQTQDDGLTMRERVDRARGKMREDVHAAAQAQAEEWSKISEETRRQYAEYEAARAKDAADFRAAVARQWTEFRDSTPKEWVEYNKKGDARSAVDFEKGKVKVEVLVPVEEKPRVKALAEEKVREQLKKVLAEKEPGEPEILKDQVKDSQGAVVTEKNADAFVKKELAPKMVVDPKPVVAQDGKPRLKVTVEVPLVPEHLRVRAERYKPIVDRYAAQYGLAPELVYAVIQTESEFNPKARSGAGAVGLMQLVPRTAANEAWLFLHKKEKAVTAEELTDPEENIQLGTTYLHMLSSRHYGKVKDEDNRRTLSIAAYNCGPGNVRRTVTSRADPDALSNDALVKVIQQNAPRETAVYVPRVQSRMPQYRGF